MSDKHIKNLLKTGSSELRTLISRAAAMNDLQAAVCASLPDEISQHVTDVSVNDRNVLAVTCSSAAWAARLRFQTDELLAHARRHGVAATHCQIKVKPTVRQTPETDTTPAPHSQRHRS